MDFKINTKLYLLLFAFIGHFLVAKSQIHSPWTKKMLLSQENKIIKTEGTFQGYKAYYGTLAHLPNVEKYTALPFLLFENSNSAPKPLLLIFNGGPGTSNFCLPEGTDSLLMFFDILLPGYRGIDIVQENSTIDTEQNPIKEIAHDATEIVKCLNYDTVFVVGHSFGTVYASEYVLTNKINPQTVIFFSPIYSSNIIDEINEMHQMIYSYFANDSSAPLYDTLYVCLKQSDVPEKITMGLIFYLSTFSNYDKLKNDLQNGVTPNISLLNVYEQQTKKVNRQSQKENLSHYFYIPQNYTFNNTHSDSFIKQALLDYFTPLIDSRLTHGEKNNKILENVTRFAGEYDYCAKNCEIIGATAHFDLWKTAYKYIINTFCEKE